MPKDDKRRESDSIAGKFKANAYSIVASITILGVLATLVYNGYIAPRVLAQIKDEIESTAHFGNTEGALLTQEVKGMKEQLDHIEDQLDTIVEFMIRGQ